MKLLFTCVICQREVRDIIERAGKERHLQPICTYCERYYSQRSPDAGNFLDRRLACRLSAIAEALHSTASCLDWETRYARS